MIKDFVRDNQAYLCCLECGAETIILQYVIDKKRNDWTIDMDKTESVLVAFTTRHRLCKKVETQLEIFEEGREKE